MTSSAIHKYKEPLYSDEGLMCIRCNPLYDNILYKSTTHIFPLTYFPINFRLFYRILCRFKISDIIQYSYSEKLK